MTNKLDNIPFNFIKTVRFVIFVLALFFVISGVWWAYTTGIFSSRAASGFVIGLSLMHHIYKFSKELNENKINGTRAFAHLLSIGKPVTCGMLVYGIIEKNIGLMLLFLFLAIFFAFAPTWWLFAVNRLNNLLINADDKDNEKNNK